MLSKLILIKTTSSPLLRNPIRVPKSMQSLLPATESASLLELIGRREITRGVKERKLVTYPLRAVGMGPVELFTPWPKHQVEQFGLWMIM